MKQLDGNRTFPDCRRDALHRTASHVAHGEHPGHARFEGERRAASRMARALFGNWRESHASTPIRLLGMGVSGLEDSQSADHGAGDLADSRSEQELDRVFDRINQRWGSAGIVHGQVLKRKPGK